MSRPCLVCQADTDAWICKPKCGKQIADAIGDLASYRHEVSLLATGQVWVYRTSGRSDDEPVPYGPPGKKLPSFLRSGQGQISLPSTPSMVNLAARELLHDADNMVTTWARHLHEQKDRPWFPILAGPLCVEDCLHQSCIVIADSRAPLTIAHVDAWLLDHIDEIRFDEAAAEIHEQITQLHRDMRRAVDRSPSRRFAGPCHAQTVEVLTEQRGGTIYTETRDVKCQRDLYAKDGQLTITCDGYRGDELGCGTVHSIADREDWKRAAITDALVTIDELLAALPKMFPGYPRPGRGVAQSWVNNGRILPRGKNHASEDLFLGSELLALVETYRPRGYAPRPNRKSGRMSA